MSTFSVVGTVKESAEILDRFTRYYLRLGAEEVHLLYDGSEAEFTAAGCDAVRGPGVRVTFCDDAFWQDFAGARPNSLSTRQRSLYGMAHEVSPTDWLLICDADEFVIDRMPMADFLDRIPAGADSVAIPPAEAVWGPGEDIRTPFGSTWFRRPGKRDRLSRAWRALSSRRLYGRYAGMYRSGILSHVLGKQLIRKSASFELINVHNARRDGAIVTRRAGDLDPALGGMELAHFDAISFDRWYVKLDRVADVDDPDFLRSIAPPRLKQIRAFAKAKRDGPEALDRLFRALYALEPWQVRALEPRGLAFRHDVFQD